ncbi:ribbon-helix-helix domain-containing protein [Heyndrickxia sp. FSL W8-0496]|uniref:ribbon-helix-helix domain-containing protein n=1 Tax=Heyndrickxia sp. FSL W8-0496 TaxID=2954702 RepID=UPI0030F4F3EC
MTRSDKKKVPFTLRMKKELSDRLEQEAEELGISKSAYINMILHKAIKQKIS